MELGERRGGERGIEIVFSFNTSIN